MKDTLNSTYNEKTYVEILPHYRLLFVKGDVIIGEWGIFGVEIFLCYSHFLLKVTSFQVELNVYELHLCTSHTIPSIYKTLTSILISVKQCSTLLTESYINWVSFQT